VSRLVVFGNSGSGKSTLALRLAACGKMPHLDLDTLAWQGVTPPRRRAVAESGRDIVAFMDLHDEWIIEGCYGDLFEEPLRRCTRLVFLNPGVEACVANARLRPWEPHKYPTKEEQDAGLEFLVGWIGEYYTRSDEFSYAAHRALFDAFRGNKLELTTCESIAAFSESQ
jgi:adenylate kinase family enzyme